MNRKPVKRELMMAYAEWPALPDQPDPALADPLDPATRLGLVPAVDPPAVPTGLGRYLVLGLRRTARTLAGLE